MFLNNRISKISILFFILLIFSFTSANAADKDKMQFAAINIQNITGSCTVFQDIRNQMNEQFQKMSKKFDEKAKAIIAEESALQKKQAVLDKSALNKRITEINTKKQNTQIELEKDKQRLQKIYFDGINVVNKKMNEVIKKYSKEKGYKIIFEMSTLVYHDIDDVTEEIIKLLNIDLPSYKIDFNAHINDNVTQATHQLHDEQGVTSKDIDKNANLMSDVSAAHKEDKK